MEGPGGGGKGGKGGPLLPCSSLHLQIRAHSSPPPRPLSLTHAASLLSGVAAPLLSSLKGTKGPPVLFSHLSHDPPSSESTSLLLKVYMGCPIFEVTLICFFLYPSTSSEDLSPDPSFPLERDPSVPILALNVTKKIVPANHDVTVGCDKSKLGGGGNITWYFQPCGSGLGQVPCEEYTGRSWEGKRVCGLADLPPCRASLLISKSKAGSSGLYKCYLLQGKPGYVTTAITINIVHLEVIYPSQRDVEFIEWPINQTVVVPERATFSCKVFSVQPIMIKWFKQVPPSLSKSKYVIKYNNQSYKEVNNVVENKQKENTYSSKLIFRSTKLEDTGLYVCSVVGTMGLNIKEAYLNVQKVPQKPEVPLESNRLDKLLGYILFSSSVLFFVCIWCAGLIYVKVAHKEPASRCQSPVPTQIPHQEMAPVPAPYDDIDTSDYEHVVSL